MSKFELKLPKMGESVAEATLTAWLKEIGDTIEFDEPVVEIATDKVDSEVPSEKKGISIEKCFKVDDVILVGQTIAIIETDEVDSNSIYEFEPSEEEILNDLLPRNLATQLFSSQMESTASELAARMTAMDNATRNAGDLVDRLTINYNRSRQAAITKELIEIISGAESL